MIIKGKLTARVSSQGAPLKEYDDPDGGQIEGEKASCVIESTEGKTFALEIRRHAAGFESLLGKKPDVTLEVTVDGQSLGSTPLLVSGKSMIPVLGFYDGINSVEPFKWGSNVRNGEGAIDEAQVSVDFHTIRVVARRVETEDASDFEVGHLAPVPGVILPEDSKKAGREHKVEFGDREFFKGGRKFGTKVIIDAGKPWAEFVFKYRSAREMQQEIGAAI